MYCLAPVFFCRILTPQIMQRASACLYLRIVGTLPRLPCFVWFDLSEIWVYEKRDAQA